MATEYWYPISGATHDIAWDSAAIVGGAGNKNVAVRPDPASRSSITHYDSYYLSLTSNESWTHQAVNISWPGPMSSLGSTFTAYIRHASAGAYTRYRYAIFCNSAGSIGGSHWAAVNDATTSWTNTGGDVSNAATYRVGGGSWAVADFANETSCQVQIASANDPTGWRTGYFSTVWGQIEYTPLGGGFMVILGLLGPMFGAFVCRGDFDKFLLWRRWCHPRGTILTDEEKDQAWREVREYRYPTYHLVGGSA